MDMCYTSSCMCGLISKDVELGSRPACGPLHHSLYGGLEMVSGRCYGNIFQVFCGYYAHINRMWYMSL